MRVDRESPSALEAGREALGREDWADAYRLLSGIDQAEPAPEELDGLADAAYGSDDLEAVWVPETVSCLVRRYFGTRG